MRRRGGGGVEREEESGASCSMWQTCANCKLLAYKLDEVTRPYRAGEVIGQPWCGKDLGERNYSVVRETDSRA